MENKTPNIEIVQENLESRVASTNLGVLAHELTNILAGNIQGIIDTFDIPQDQIFRDISKEVSISNPIQKTTRVGASIILVGKSKKQLSKSAAQKIIGSGFGNIKATPQKGYIDLEYNSDSVGPKDLKHILEKKIGKKYKCLIIKYGRAETLDSYFRTKNKKFPTFHTIEKKNNF